MEKPEVFGVDAALCVAQPEIAMPFLAGCSAPMMASLASVCNFVALAGA